MSDILWAALIGAGGGAIGAALGQLFPARFRPFVIGLCVALAIAGIGPIRTFIEKETMTPERFERAAMAELESNYPQVHRIMLLYRKHAPDLFGNIMEEASQAYRDGKKEAGIANVIRTQITGYVASRLKELSDDGLIVYTDLVTKQLEQLESEGRDGLCVRIMRGDQLGVVKWSEKMKALELQMVRSMVMDEGGSGEPAEQEEVDRAVNAAVAGLIEMHGQEKVTQVFANLSDADAKAAGACEVFADYFTLLQKAADPRRAQILRTIYSSGT